MQMLAVRARVERVVGGAMLCLLLACAGSGEGSVCCGGLLGCGGNRRLAARAVAAESRAVKGACMCCGGVSPSIRSRIVIVRRALHVYCTHGHDPAAHFIVIPHRYHWAPRERHHSSASHTSRAVVVAYSITHSHTDKR